MPNLNQIYSLKENFYQLTAKDKQVKEYIEKSEARDTIQKSFNSRSFLESREETRLISFLTESLSVKPGLIKYFEEAKEEDVCLLFIDITSFSKTICGWPNSEIKVYLDDYYNRIIPIIYNNGGEIEKLLGDGIICVFGKPFLNLNSPDYVYKAEECAEEVIKEFHGTDKNVKVAIHKGEINYYKVPGEHYGEYTMIGQPITELYRLESVSMPNSINFYDDSTYDELGWSFSRFSNKIDLEKTKVSCRKIPINPLQGVNFSKLGYLQFPNYK